MKMLILVMNMNNDWKFRASINGRVAKDWSGISTEHDDDEWLF